MDERVAFIGESDEIEEVRRLVGVFGTSSEPVLVEGETGAGKEAVARMLHSFSLRSGLFMPVNCARLGGALLDSEVFGHVKGAFTGAVHERRGLIEIADGGTLFLDEVGDMPPDSQANLLRVLEAGRVRPVGGNVERAVDVRIVAATHQDLEARTRDGLFREDLYYRLNVLRIHVPSLRDREEDIPLLVKHFASGRPVSREALEAMKRFSWPGNVRQLRSVVAVAALLAGDGPILLEHLPEELRSRMPLDEAQGSTSSSDSSAAGSAERSPFILREPVPLDQAVGAYVRWVVDWHVGNKTQAARALHIAHKTLRRRLEGKGRKRGGD